MRWHWLVPVPWAHPARRGGTAWGRLLGTAGGRFHSPQPPSGSIRSPSSGTPVRARPHLARSRAAGQARPEAPASRPAGPARHGTAGAAGGPGCGAGAGGRLGASGGGGRGGGGGAGLRDLLLALRPALQGAQGAGLRAHLLPGVPGPAQRGLGAGPGPSLPRVPRAHPPARPQGAARPAHPPGPTGPPTPGAPRPRIRALQPPAGAALCARLGAPQGPGAGAAQAGGRAQHRQPERGRGAAGTAGVGQGGPRAGLLQLALRHGRGRGPHAHSGAGDLGGLHLPPAALRLQAGAWAGELQLAPAQRHLGVPGGQAAADGAPQGCKAGPLRRRGSRAAGAVS